MTEAEWLACTDPDRLYAGAADAVSWRKSVLVATACASRGWRGWRGPLAATAVPLTTLEALTSAEALDRAPMLHALEGVRLVLARNVGRYVSGDYVAGFGRPRNFHQTVANVITLARLIGVAGLAARSSHANVKLLRLKERRIQRHLIRDVFGNPFRPPRLDPHWLTANDGAVRGLASAIDAGQDFRRLPILADALEDAGCSDEIILAHCRSGGTHVRGCWVIDLVLGKS